MPKTADTTTTNKYFDPIRLDLVQLDELTNGEMRRLSKTLGQPFQRIEQAFTDADSDIDVADIMWEIGKVALARNGIEPSDDNADRVVFNSEDSTTNGEGAGFPDKPGRT